MVFLRLANLFHKFVDKMTLHVLYLPLHEKRITKKSPPPPAWPGTLTCPHHPPHPLASLKRPLPYQRYRLISQEISKRAAMDEYSLTPPPPKLEGFINLITWQANKTRQQDYKHDTSIWWLRDNTNQPRRNVSLMIASSNYQTACRIEIRLLTLSAFTFSQSETSPFSQDLLFILYQN